MSDLRSRVPAQSLMERTLELHPRGFALPDGDALPWFTDALGEIAVAGVLAWLSREWTVLHSVPVGRGENEIDHVAIGPPGVFTISTKSHARQRIRMTGPGLYVGGQAQPYIRIAIHEAANAQRLLTAASGIAVPVTPVIVFVNPGRRTVKAPPDGGVRVVADWELLGVLSGTRRLSRVQVERIVAAAVRSTTWSPSPTPFIDSRRLTDEFNAIMARAHHGASLMPATTRETVVEPDASAPTASQSHAPRPVARRRPTGRSGTRDLLTKLGLIAAVLWVYWGMILPLLLGTPGR